ncbi:hypothetical protein, partial [Nocardia xishanensis]
MSVTDVGPGVGRAGGSNSAGATAAGAVSGDGPVGVPMTFAMGVVAASGWMVVPADFDAARWASVLELYRPFLSYSELGALVDG